MRSPRATASNALTAQVMMQASLHQLSLSFVSDSFPLASSLSLVSLSTFYSNHQFRLPKDFQLSITGSGMTARSEGVYKRNAFASLDTSISKSINKKLFITLAANNIFNSLSYQESFHINGIASNGTYFTIPDFAFSLRYSFGAIGNQRFKNREIDDNSKRIN